MAIVTWPLSSAEARGRVGDLIYNTWRGRSYVKSFALHQSEFSTAQIAARAVSALVTAAWQALDDEHRSQWDAFAESHLISSWTGSPKRISAYNWFMRLGWNANFFFDGPNVSPPVQLPSYVISNCSVSWSYPELTVFWTPQTVEPSEEWILSFLLEGPYLHQRKQSIKRAVFFDAGQEYQGFWPLTIPSPGWWGVHVNAIGHCGVKIPQANFMVECR